MDSYSSIDSNLAEAQLAIGESSNLAQVCLTYGHSFEDEKYKDFACILAVLAQVAIDNAKRRYAINLSDEIAIIKKQMNIEQNGYPMFWSIIRPGFKLSRINKELICPMNYLCKTKFKKVRDNTPTIPITSILVKPEVKPNKKKCKKVEELISKYAIDLYDFNKDAIGAWDVYEKEMYTMNQKLTDLIDDIKRIYVSNNYIDLMYWLLRRCFEINDSKLSKNKSSLVNVLFSINPRAFLSCFKETKQK